MIKNYAKLILVFIGIIYFSFNINAQCTVTIVPSSTLIGCGVNATLTALSPTPDQNQPSNTVCMAGFGQVDLAQSFISTINTSCGAGIQLESSGSGTGVFTLQLWTNLPTLAGVMIASGTCIATPSAWCDVSWPPVGITPGATYYLVFFNTNNSFCYGGDTGDPYPFGQVYANPGYGSFPTFDYTFHTFSCSGSSYLWSTGSTSATITPTLSGVYTVTAVIGTCTTTASYSLTVTPNPTVTVNSGTICSGKSFTIVPAGASTYTIQGGSAIVTPLASTTYTVKGTSIAGCVSAIVISSVTVVGTPTISVSSGSICSGSSFTIIPSGASTYTIQGGSAIVSPVINTTYSVVGTSSLGCVGSNTAICSITINPNPTITVSSGTICSGSSFTMAPSGASTYTFQGGSSVVSPIVSTTYTISGTNASGCSAITTCSVTVISAASITVSPLTSTICLGQTANLIASGGLTYTWTASSGATPPSVANVTVSPLVNTTYTVLSGSGTCTAQAVSSVIVSPAFSLVGAPNPTTICSGGLGVVLTVSGATSYTWSGLGLSTTTGSIVTATPLVNTTYTIVGSNGSCSSATLITVNVTSVSTTVTASATSYCTGGLAVTLTGSGATTYSWSPAAGLSTTTGAVVSATPTISTVYTVVGTTGLCTSTKTISISVSTTSSLTIASTGTVICPGSSGVTLTGSGASTYTWLPGGTTVNPLLANPASTTVYTLTGTSAGGCISIPAVITVSVLPAINPVLSSSSASVCLTKTVTLSATPVGAGYSYTWSPAGAILGPVNGASIIAKPVSAASPVIYTLLISNGVCVETSTIALNVIVCSPPVSSFNTLTNDSICTGGCVTFNATSLGTPPLTYEWYFEGGTPAFSTLAAPEVCYFAAGNYSVALVTANPFGTDTIIKLNYINVADTPAVVRAFNDTLIKIGQVAPIYATGATYYQWLPNNGTIACPSCSNTVVQPTVTTQYIVIGSNSPYCKRQDTIIVQVDFTCGDFFVPNVFSPNADGLNDVVMVNGFCIGTFNLKIFSRWGEKVFETSEKSNGWDGTYKGKPMDTGVFIYKVDGITIDGKPFVIKGNITLLR